MFSYKSAQYVTINIQSLKLSAVFRMATPSSSEPNRGRVIRSPELSVPRRVFAIGSFFSPSSQRSAESSGHTSGHASIQSSPPVRIKLAHERMSTPTLQTHHHMHTHGHVEKGIAVNHN